MVESLLFPQDSAFSAMLDFSEVKFTVCSRVFAGLSWYPCGKSSISRTGDMGFDSDLPQSSHTSDFNIDT